MQGFPLAICAPERYEPGSPAPATAHDRDGDRPIPGLDHGPDHPPLVGTSRTHDARHPGRQVVGILRPQRAVDDEARIRHHLQRGFDPEIVDRAKVQNLAAGLGIGRRERRPQQPCQSRRSDDRHDEAPTEAAQETRPSVAARPA